MITPQGDDAGERAPSPLEVVEQMALGNNWPFEHGGDDEIEIVISGAQAIYQVAFTWMSDIEVLHLSCAFNLKVPEERRPEVQKLILKVNEELWIGHFDIWTEGGVIMFRYGLVLAGRAQTTHLQCEALLGAALDACERHFPAFNYIIWAGKNAEEALQLVNFDTAGEA